RELSADEFLQGLYSTTLEDDEIVVRVSFAIPQSCGYAKFRNPASRYAMAAAFVSKFTDRVRVSITGAGNDGAFRWRDAEDALAADFSEFALDDLRLDP